MIVQLDKLSMDFHMLKNVEINNFKCFRSAELTDAKRLNIIVGHNGAGKTALLEALFMASGGNAELVMRTKAFRGLEISLGPNFRSPKSSLWVDFFHNFDPTHAISISFNGSGLHNRKLSIYSERASSLLPIDASPESQIQLSDSDQIVFEWRDENSETHISRPTQNAKGFDFGNHKSVSFQAGYHGITVAASPTEAAERFSDIKRKKSDPKTEQLLIEMFPEISSLFVGAEGGKPILFVNIKHLDNAIPIQAFSAGASKIASTLLMIEHGGFSLIYIDEIEVGMHHSILGKMWCAIMSLAKQKNAQLFISTHSEENLSALSEACKDSLDDIAMYRIEQEEGCAKILGFQGADLASAMEYGSEVR